MSWSYKFFKSKNPKSLCSSMYSSSHVNKFLFLFAKPFNFYFLFLLQCRDESPLLNCWKHSNLASFFCIIASEYSEIRHEGNVIYSTQLNTIAIADVCFLVLVSIFSKKNEIWKIGTIIIMFTLLTSYEIKISKQTIIKEDR